MNCPEYCNLGGLELFQVEGDEKEQTYEASLASRLQDRQPAVPSSPKVWA